MSHAIFSKKLNYLCSSYPDELRLCIGLGKSPQLSMSTKCKTQHARRRRQGTRKQVQGTRAQRAHASTTHVLAGTGYLPRQTGGQSQWNGTRMQVQSTRTQKGHAVQTPGQWHRTCRCRCAVSWLLSVRLKTCRVHHVVQEVCWLTDDAQPASMAPHGLSHRLVKWCRNLETKLTETPRQIRLLFLWIYFHRSISPCCRTALRRATTWCMWAWGIKANASDRTAVRARCVSPCWPAP